MKLYTVKFIVFLFVLISSSLAKPISNIEVIKSSGDYKEYDKNQAIDGVVTDASRWIGTKDSSGKIWLELKLDEKIKLKSFALYSGFERRSFVENFHLEFKNDLGNWQKIDSSVVVNNKSTKCVVSLDKAVETTALKLVVTKTPDDLARVREVVFYTDLSSSLKENSNSTTKSTNLDFDVYPEVITRKLGTTTVKIDPKGFRFSFIDQDGKVIAPANESAGLKIDNHVVFLSKVNSDGSYDVITKHGKKAVVTLEYNKGKISFKLKSDRALGQTSLALGSLPVAYGLGDAGGWNSDLNLIGSSNKTHTLRVTPGGSRWASSFVVFPLNNLAGVVHKGEPIKVTLGPKIYSMNISAGKEDSFHYFVGDMKDIYKNYRSHLDLHNYPKIKPKFRWFELGWESWAALGYQTNAETVLKSVQQFQKDGYRVRWAITGSGFWDEGGTTTSFGRFGKKFPDPKGFKKALNDADVKWMIGLRTNFVLPGGPHIPKSSKRDHNLKGDMFYGNPISKEGLEKGYFVMKKTNEPLILTSPYFPIVPCYILDGRKPEAVKWYVDLYNKWGVDGIKEDTMMSLNDRFINIYDQPIAQIAKEGALVMGRCGSFSSPGTLQRINDTKVDDAKKRIPINYLQYAASGAPNVYSDTVGFRKMRSYSKTIIAQAWVTSLTAGMAVGESPKNWSEKQQAILKRPFDFHYEIGPQLYDAAMKSYESGFPYTMTPLSLAFPGDKQATEIENFQWMIGESLLCTPQLRNPGKETLDIYLPAGDWYDYDSGEKFSGPQILKDYPMPVTKTPCFVGGEGIVVLRDQKSDQLKVKVYPMAKDEFVFNHPDGKSKTVISFSSSVKMGVFEEKSQAKVSHEVCPKTKAISFTIEAGKNYILNKKAAYFKHRI
ncbi:glycoside hydrolase family 31 protein [Lentisphaera marina]|uniref:TIM-barrel domain-containing protein n=1 Tax=Lentisphaera marina TaxID=1111041 RepID=UPI002364FFB1|nr:TIM-barrel domain-containing protein [Lentisphaera marina]MDD7985248.1 glycoside hydrolase family 31 protein [Lentisphaera marina]